MRRRFISKKKYQIVKVIKYIFYLLIIYLFLKLVFIFISHIKLMPSNEVFFKYLLSDANHHLIYPHLSEDIFDKTIKTFSNITINKPLSIVSNSFNIKNKSVVSVDDTYNNYLQLESITTYVDDPHPKDIENPKIYIYNSHQLENYAYDSFSFTGLTPNVMVASYLLKDHLNDVGIQTIVETANITEYMKLNDLDSYDASRYYITDALDKNPSLKLLIDIHRDVLSNKKATTKIDNKKCAKILFVVGLENPHYEKNFELVNKLNNMIKGKYPSLTRGIITKKGRNVNGIYNQDINSNIILLELGSNESTIEEVSNTIDILTNIIKEYMGEIYE